jgi:hypothetical protein
MPLETVSPEAAYATRGNIAFPGTQAQATAAEALAQARLATAAQQPLASTTIGAGSIKVAT